MSSGLTSLETALGVLDYLAQQDGAQALTDIARGCDMPPSKVHRYLTSFTKAGLVRQDGPSGRYDLGKGAMQLGLAALARHDFVNHAADGMAELAAETGMTVLLAVWADKGATVVRWERGVSPTLTSMGLGTSLPLLNSATGRAFLAWAPKQAIRAARDAELRRIMRAPELMPDVPATKAGLDALVGSIREAGFASVDGRYIPGLVAAAAPIVDWQGEAQAVITLVGTEAAKVIAATPEIAALRQFCDDCSVT